MKIMRISRFRQGCLLWVARLAGGIIGLLLITSIGGGVARSRMQAETPAPGQMVDVGGYRLHLNCFGEGSPTVILEAGQGNMGLIWTLVQTEVARFTRVCAYDRAGLGWSESGRAPRSVHAIVHELHTLLINGKEEGPFVLVGHSLGGLFVRQYAKTFPNEVVGMVLVDSVHEDRFVRSIAKEISYLRQMIQVMPLLYGVQKIIAYTGIPALLPSKGIQHPNIPEKLSEYYQTVMISRISYIDGVSREIQSLEDYYQQVQEEDIHSVGDIPLIVLTHGRSLPLMGLSEDETGQSEAIWRQFQIELSAQSKHGELITAQESGHDIHLDQPHLVVDAIRKVLDTYQATGISSP